MKTKKTQSVNVITFEFHKESNKEFKANKGNLSNTLKIMLESPKYRTTLIAYAKTLNSKVSDKSTNNLIVSTIYETIKAEAKASAKGNYNANNVGNVARRLYNATL